MLNNKYNVPRPSYWNSRTEISTSSSKTSIKSKGTTLLLLPLHKICGFLKGNALWLNVDEWPQAKY